MTDTVKQSTFGTRELTDITADAVAIQERDEFREQGWTKLIAPAKVNLYLAIGEKRPNGYHNAATVLHAINLHDIVYIRRKPGGADAPEARIVAQGDIVAPDLASEDNIACKAVLALAQATGFENEAGLEIRIEKNIPAQAGLGGGSTDAAAALIGAARIWGVPADSSVLEETARHLGADVAFFLHGGCTYLEGTGDTFVRSLEPSKRSIVLVKPDCGVSTGEAYRTFDENPSFADECLANAIESARSADEVPLFNNLAHASETLVPELAAIRSWLCEQEGVTDALLCGSGSCTFAICDSFSDACRIVAAARQKGLWARATSFGSAHAPAITS